MMKYFLRIAALLALLGFPSMAEAASRFAVCTTTCTWDASNTAMWSTSSGGATGASVPGAADAVVLDAATCVGGTACTITVNTSPHISSLTMGACTASTTGCVLDFSANNNNLTVLAINVSGTGIRTLNCGTGTFSLTGTGSIWDLTTSTNATVNCSGVSFVSNGTAATRAFIGNGKSYGSLTIGSSNFNFQITTGNNTFSTLNVTGPLDLRFLSGVTTTITNPPTFTSTASGPVLLHSTTANAIATLAFTGGATASFLGFVDITCTGSPTFTSSFDFGNNSNCGITGPTSGGSGGHIIGG